MTVSSKLPFEPDLNTVCKKVSHKLYALARVSNHIFQQKLNYNEIVYNIAVWLLPIGTDVPQQTVK